MLTVTRLAALLVVMTTATTAGVVEPAKVAGKWNGSLKLESIQSSPTLTFVQEGEKLTGTYQGYYGASPIEGTVKEKEINFTVTYTIEGSKIQAVFTGTVDGDSMGGRVEFEGAGSGTWSATRAK
jgi:hypothetical protein